MAAKQRKPRKGFMDGYKTYDPDKEGYGSPDQWKDAFRARMSAEEVAAALGDEDPLVILGFDAGSQPSWDAIKSAYRAHAFKHHPDRNVGDDEAPARFKRVQAAYDALAGRYGK